MHTEFWRGNHTATKLGEREGYHRWIELAQRSSQWRHFVRAVYNRGVLLPQNSVCRVSGQQRTALHDCPKHRFANSAGVRIFVELFEQNLCGITSVFNPTNSLGGLGKEAKVTKASVVPAGFGFPLQLIFIKLQLCKKTQQYT